MGFEFATVSQIVFGEGKSSETGKFARNLGKRILLIRGSSEDRLAPIIRSLAAEDLSWESFQILEEPTVDAVRRGIEQLRYYRPDLVIAAGGGSVLDAGKAIAALATNPGDLYNYLEVIGDGMILENPGLAVIAIPTTAGTGAEVTRNAVIGSPKDGVKVSLRSPYVLPKVAIVDPKLTLDMPTDLTAYTGMDALTQLIEPFVSIYANPLTDALCLQGIEHVGKSIRSAFHTGKDLKARTDMSIAALFGGMALANAMLGVVHGFAGVLGGMYSAPHGAICARLLPFVTRINTQALREREPGSPALHRYRQIGGILCGRPGSQEDASDAINWLTELNKEMGIPSLSTFGIQPSDAEEILDRVELASSTRGNPIRLTREELGEIFFNSI